jgi:hypothetical protein
MSQGISQCYRMWQLPTQALFCDKLLNQYQLSPIVITVTPKKAKHT